MGVSTPAPAGTLQRKLTIGAVDDPHEHEADRVADQVLRMPDPVPPGIAPDAGRAVQRACAACENEEPVQRAPTGAGAAGGPAPPGVAAVARAPGQPLDPGTRGFFEPRFGRDLGGVRIHADAGADAASRSIRARAFTLANHVAFAGGEYAPGTDAGRRLLAHELAHVVQQDAAGPLVRRLALSPLFDGAADPDAPQPAQDEAAAGGPEQTVQRAPVGGGAGADPADPAASHGGTLPYRQATNLLDCIRIMGEANADECRHQFLGTPRPMAVCVPASDPGWSDFAGTPPAHSSFGAETDWHFEVAVTDSGTSIIRAIFDGARSWVKPASADPSNRAVNGGARLVTECRAGLANGQSWRSLGPVTGCAASPQPDTTLRATTAGECDTILGAEWDRVAALESARLLTHEQYHFKLACVMAGKGTAALAAGSTRTPEQIRQTVATKTSALSSRYDTQTTHGCNAGAQAAWQADVDAGLPATTVP